MNHIKNRIETLNERIVSSINELTEFCNSFGVHSRITLNNIDTNFYPEKGWRTHKASELIEASVYEFPSIYVKSFLRKFLKEDGYKISDSMKVFFLTEGQYKPLSHIYSQIIGEDRYIEIDREVYRQVYTNRGEWDGLDTNKRIEKFIFPHLTDEELNKEITYYVPASLNYDPVFYGNPRDRKQKWTWG